MPGQRALLTVVITDAVGFSIRAGHDEESALRELNADFDVMRIAVEAHGGRVVKSTGDGLLMTFDIPGQAVDCCLDIQTQFQSRGPDSLLHRIGVHLCEVVSDGADVHGDGVNVAARLETQASPGSIAMSQTVYDIVKSRLSVQPRFVGTRDLKNISTPVSVYELSPGGAPKRRSASVAPRRNWGLALGIAGIIGSIATLAGVIWVRGEQPTEIIYETIPGKGVVAHNVRDAPNRVKSEIKTPTQVKSHPAPTSGPVPPKSTPTPPTTTKPTVTESLPNTIANAKPSDSTPTSDNPFVTDPLPGNLASRRTSMVLAYDYDGVLSLMNGSSAFKALPYFNAQVRTFTQLSRLKSVVDAALKAASPEQPLMINYTPIGATGPIKVGAWGSLDGGVQVKGPNGGVTTQGLKSMPPTMFRSLAVESCATTLRPNETKQLLSAFDRVYSELRQGRRAKSAVQMDQSNENQ